MAIQQVKRNLTGLKRIAGNLSADSISKSFGIQGSANDEIKNSISEWIVHNRIELVALKPTG
ncbi:hypothetical protein D3C73_885520 [compost metagenome]